ncbi:MAG: DUF6088 family protein [Phycisphaerales bacterium]
MDASSAHTYTDRPAAQAVRARVARGGERLWRFSDFADLPPDAVAQALSRLAKAGVVRRLSKGTYYRARETALGTSRPNPAAVQKLATKRAPLFPAGMAAANLLGFSTQAPSRSELATTASSVPRKLVGKDTIVHTRRPAAWVRLSKHDAALLDFLRDGGRLSELSPAQTVERTFMLLQDDDRYARLLGVAETEPPRVRALLGAMGELLGVDPVVTEDLRGSLNPLSRFSFGVFAELPNAKGWQAVRPVASSCSCPRPNLDTIRYGTDRLLC